MSIELSLLPLKCRGPGPLSSEKGSQAVKDLARSNASLASFYSFTLPLQPCRTIYPGICMPRGGRGSRLDKRARGPWGRRWTDGTMRRFRRVLLVCAIVSWRALIALCQVLSQLYSPNMDDSLQGRAHEVASVRPSPIKFMSIDPVYTEKSRSPLSCQLPINKSAPRSISSNGLYLCGFQPRRELL